MRQCDRARHAFPLPWLDDGSRTERQQAHHRADLEPTGTAIRKAQDVVVETIPFVPPCPKFGEFGHALSSFLAKKLDITAAEPGGVSERTGETSILRVSMSA